MTIYNINGNENGKQVYTVREVTASGATSTSTVNEEVFDKGGRPVAKSTNKVECTGGTMMMDMKMFIPAQQLDQIRNTEVANAVSYLEYPANMEVGEKLKDGQLNMNVITNGIITSIDMRLTNRFVEAKEKITSAAGSWDAFRISYHSKMKMKIAGIGVPVYSEISEWYAPDFGIVKTETKSGSALVTAVR